MSGFYTMPALPGRHQGVPVKDTWRTEDGQPADLLRGPYPVTATCAMCGGRITLSARMQMEWQHVPGGEQS